MKNHEQLAEEYAFNIFRERYESLIGEEQEVYSHAKDAFLAGYKAAQDQLADADKVMPDTCEHILDMEKMVDVNGWISVKNGRPEPEKVVLAYNPTMFGVTTAVRSVVNHWLLTQPAFGTTLGINGKPPVVTHWQELPEPPKEEE
jgi:hypothetical protein